MKTYPIYGQYLRDIPILPDHISSEVEGWRLEAWNRFDPRIRKHDLVNRMPLRAPGGHNTELSMRAQRFRKDAKLLGWVAKGRNFDAEKQRLTTLLQAAGVPLNLNTTRGISWGANPYGQWIPVPRSLSWASCVEAAPAQAPAASAVPAIPAVMNTILPPLAAAGPAPVPAPRVPAIASAASLVTSTNTYPLIHGTNIPVTQALNVQGGMILAAPAVIAWSRSSSSSSSPSPRTPINTPSPPRNAAANTTSTTAIPTYLLDPQLSQPCPLGQLPITGTMNPPTRPEQLPATGTGPPRRSTHVEPLVNFGGSIAVSSESRPQQNLLHASTSSAGPRSLSLPGALHAIGSLHDAARSSSARATSSLAKGTKRDRDDEEQEQDPGYVDSGNQQLTKKQRLPADDEEPEKKFRKRSSRAAFGGGGEQRPHSFGDWVQQGGSSNAVTETDTMNLEHQTLARPSLGYHDQVLYYHDGDGNVIATPDDFVHPNGVDAGRRMRIDPDHLPRLDFNPDKPLIVGDWETRGWTLLDPQPGANPVEYSAQSMGRNLPEANDEQSNLLPLDVEESEYPGLRAALLDYLKDP